MPAFEGAEDFPTSADHLTPVHFEAWLGLIFVSLNPAVPFEEMTRPMRERLNWLPLDTLHLVEEGTTDYHVNAHWALYCDNFLEGFHIPFVHPALNAAIDFEQYAYEIFPHCNLQIGIADEGQPHFEAPEGHPDFGRKIYAYYYWLFPNLMFNFYPWGLSLNVVEPQGLQKTRIRFRTYLYKDATHQRSLNNLEATELEDEAVVESVQRGIQSRYYHSGRFSPTMEQGVHHFHSLLAKII
jgi:choline monooxygenase